MTPDPREPVSAPAPAAAPAPAEPDPAAGLIDPRVVRPGPEILDPAPAGEGDTALQVTELPELDG